MRRLLTRPAPRPAIHRTGWPTSARTLTLAIAVAGLMAAAPRAQTPARPQGATVTDRNALIAAARAIMTKVGICSVITVDETGRPQARAIDAFPPDEQMVVWFATNPKTRKVNQIRRDPRVTLYYFDAGALSYVTLLGRARLVNDPAEKTKHWKDSFKAFWPDRGEGYLLVEVTPERIEVVSPAQKIFNDPVTWLPPSVTFEPARRKQAAR